MATYILFPVDEPARPDPAVRAIQIPEIHKIDLTHQISPRVIVTQPGRAVLVQSAPHQGQVS
jgi:hypothetical protein